jgi:soluble lytic murein transglycosylase
LYPAYYSDLVLQEAQQFGLDPLLLFSLIRQESLFDRYARSGSDARGLAQVIPPTARDIAQRLNVADFQLHDLYKPQTSVRFGASYLSTMLKHFDGNTLHALAAYNAGPGNTGRWVREVADAGEDVFVESIMYAETNTYVKQIALHLAQYQRLYGVSNP